MGLIQKLKNVWRGFATMAKYGTEAWELWERTSFADGGKRTLPVTRPDQIREYETGLWTYACCSVKARAAADVPFRLMRVVRQGPDERVNEHEILKLLERPMPKKTYQQLVEAHVTYKELAGAAYVRKVRRSSENVPVGLQVLHSGLTSPIVQAQEGVVGFSYRANGKGETIDADDVVYDPYFSPTSPEGGLAPTVPAWITCQMDKAARKWNWDFFENGAEPDVLLSSEGPIPHGEMQRILSDFRGRNSNRASKSRGAYLVTHGVKVDKMSASHREMQFERLLGMSREEIAAVYHVPHVLLGLETMNYATADKQLEVFVWHHLVPLVESMLRQYTIELVEEWPGGEELYLEVDREALKTSDDRAKEADAVRQDFQAGIISRPEARVKRGYPARETDAPGEINGRDVRDNSEPEDGGGAGGGRGGTKKEPTPEVPPGSTLSTDTTGASSEPAAKRVEPKARPRTPYQVSLAKADKARPIERDLTVAMSRRLQSQRGKAAAWARKKFGVSASAKAAGSNGTNGTVHHDDADPDGDEDGHARGLVWDRLTMLKADGPASRKAISEEEIRSAIEEPLGKAVEDALRRAVEAGGSTTADSLGGVAFDMKDERVRDFLGERRTRLEDVLDEDTARAVKQAILSAYDRGESELGTVTAVMDAGAFSPSRAMRIARTETHLAMQKGSHEGMVQAGVEKRSWLTALDSAVRESHAVMHGQVRGIDEPFESGDGEELLFPGDPDAPASEVCNCRCSTIAEFEPTTPQEVTDALDVSPADGEEADDAIEGKIADAADELPEQVTRRIDPEDVKSLRYEAGTGRQAEYDPDERLATIGPRAKIDDVETVIEQHLASSLMSAADAVGFRNQLVAADLVDPKTWDALEGTARAKAVKIQAALIARDWATVGDLLGGELDEEEQALAARVSDHFWTVGRNVTAKPRETNPK